MVRLNPLQNIATRGGLLTADFLQSLREENFNHPLIQPKTFSLPEKTISTLEDLNQIISEAWERLKARWDDISLTLENMDVSDARKKWILPLLRELGFSEITSVGKNAPLEDESIKIHLSHRGWWEEDGPPIHTVSPKHELDERWSSDRNDRSPHDALQLYLNLNKMRSDWGMVTNGVILRILREFYHTYTRGYIEFDLVNILNERNFTDFRTLFRLAHASRFRSFDGSIPIEQFYEESVAAGVKIGEDLRYNVKNAIELLGNGLLNRELRQNLVEDPELTKVFYQELLKIIYRVLFLMYAEQRGMLPMRDSLYAEEYSLARLRERSEKRILQDANYDLWHGLMATFALIREGSEDLKVFGYNGELFDDTELKIISNLQCRNDILLKVIRYLTCYEKGKILQRINFLDIGVEEIGAIYESLLDFTPRVLETVEIIENREYSAGHFILDPRGAARKTTGSYYTDKRLINELIDSALRPVLENALTSRGSSLEEKENAILDLKVCDPACGSGAFLIAANDFLGKELAQIRTGEEFPSEMEVRKARRDVLSQCIYGVDLNPMAIELAKVSLWINAAVRDLPLNFLDHHLKCGNSLIGTTPELISKGILDVAFQAFNRESKKIASQLKKINTKQRKMKTLDMFFVKPEETIQIKEFDELKKILEISKEDVIQKKKKYLKLIQDDRFTHQKLIYNTWTSIFFWPFTEEFKDAPTQGIFQLISEGSLSTVSNSLVEKIQEISEIFSFFHWDLEFPEVFNSQNGGFDCILGNPPWDTVAFNEKDFFLGKDPEIVQAPNASKRKKLIATLNKKNPELFSDFQDALFKHQKTSKYFRFSGKYPLTGKGRMNTYSLFVETVLTILSTMGKAGMVIQSGLATDDTTKDLFRHIIESHTLLSLYDFEKPGTFFPDVSTRRGFSLITLTGSKAPVRQTDFIFFRSKIDERYDEERHLFLEPDDFDLLNPNTKTCPIFRTRKDAEIVKSIYERIPVLILEEPKMEENHWGIKFKQGLFNMASDSGHFRNYNQLESEGFRIISPNIFHKDNQRYLPLYEGKMIHYFDHRFGTYSDLSSEKIRKGLCRQMNLDEKNDPSCDVIPRYWVKENLVQEKAPEANWFLCFRDIAAATDERTLICTVIPYAAVGHKLPLIIPSIKGKLICVLLANLSSLILDYIVRTKASGVSLSFYIIKQLPIIPPREYNEELLDLISPKVIELVYTSNSLHYFAKECGFDVKPFKWEIDRRAKLIAELDAIYAHLYGLTKDELDYIIETFGGKPWDKSTNKDPKNFVGLKKKDFDRYGEFKTKNLILHFFDKYDGKIRKVESKMN